jgi:hypothetical protein
MSERDPARAHLDSLYHDLFEVDARGAVVMEDLYQRFAAHAKVHTEGGIDAVLKTYKDASKREVIDYMVRCINRHRAVNDFPPPPETSDELP